jgi:pimeloyl-ACP methyl ester carboxylesterase
MSEARLYHEVHGGQGPFLLLVHGILSSRAQWAPNLEALSAFCRPVVVELFGHGRSPSPDDPAAYSLDNYAAEFERIRALLGAERWFVCGQSMGALLTFSYVLAHPDRVLAHVFTNSRSALSEPTSPEGARFLAERLKKEGRKIIDQFPLHPSRNNHLKPEIKKLLVEEAERIDPLGLANTVLYTSARGALLGRLKDSRVPTLLVVGRFDRAFAPLVDVARQLLPHLEILVLDGGHAVNLDAPDTFNQAVRTFLARYAPPPAP